MRKKFLTICVMIALITVLAGCASEDSQGIGSPGSKTTATMEGETTDCINEKENDSHRIATEEQQGETADHAHQLSDGGNVLEHDPVGYCGNTVTKVSYTPFGETEKEAWEASFWGDKSVTLTDLLLYLDYSEGVCRCTPEYIVDTEFGKSFGVNLTEGYVRYEDAQVSLTEEQLEEIRDILDWAEQDRKDIRE